MIITRTGAAIGMVIAIVAFAPALSEAQTGDAPSCKGQLTHQLRRFSEACIADVVATVASKPRMGAKISGEKEKYYVLLVKDAKGFRAEAVSKFNFPLIRDETIAALKRLGWTPPENEADNWKKLGVEDAARAALAGDLADALEAYGLKPGEAISLTVGPDVTS